jgi:predicted DNA-binding transcriptional regulator AlpA
MAKSQQIQPIAVLDNPDALLTTRTTSAVSGLSESTMDRRSKAGTFPKPVKVGPRCKRYIAGDISAWLRAQRVQP